MGSAHDRLTIGRLLEHVPELAGRIVPLIELAEAQRFLTYLRHTNGWQAVSSLAWFRVLMDAIDARFAIEGSFSWFRVPAASSDHSARTILRSHVDNAGS